MLFRVFVSVSPMYSPSSYKLSILLSYAFRIASFLDIVVFRPVPVPVPAPPEPDPPVPPLPPEPLPVLPVFGLLIFNSSIPRTVE